MRNYEKPEIKVTSYEAEKIMLMSGTVQGTGAASIKSVEFNTIDF